VYASIIEDDKATRDKLTVLCQAAAVCEDALATSTTSDSGTWKEVEARLSRLRGRVNAAAKAPPASPYNTRPAHRSRFVRP
jgi:hypothetical protein